MVHYDETLWTWTGTVVEYNYSVNWTPESVQAPDIWFTLNQKLKLKEFMNLFLILHSVISEVLLHNSAVHLSESVFSLHSDVLLNDCSFEFFSVISN